MRLVKPGVLVLGWNTVIKLIRFEKQAFCLHFSVLGVWKKKKLKKYIRFSIGLNSVGLLWRILDTVVREIKISRHMK